jgi:hypothetical protein
MFGGITGNTSFEASLREAPQSLTQNTFVIPGRPAGPNPEPMNTV